MLKKIYLDNYRCFEKTEIPFHELTIIVGKNNAGKSTLIEALRILSLVVNRSKSVNYTKPPQWLKLMDGVLGISPSLNNLDISEYGIFFMYREGPAIIMAEFENGTRVSIYIGEGMDLFATIMNNQGVYVESKKFAISLKLSEINILPQISPVLREEPLIKHETVLRNLPTSLSSRNFRNQLYYYPNEFNKFKLLAEKTWHGLQIHSELPERTQGNLFLYIRDNNFEAEIGLMGHGLQMWLQTMWFLSRTKNTATLILDEPDVYMHADLQRRLIKILKNSYKQVIIATHSIEIMSEVEPDNILPINNAKPKQQYANKMPIVQKIVDEIGSVHNLEITRLFSYNKFLIMEGDKDDIKLLTIFQSKIFPNTFEQFDILPKTFIEGWGGWQRVIGANKVFKENKSTITTYCIFDSDYHTIDQKNERMNESKLHEINLHIWNKKEIENYLLNSNAIFRLLKNKKKQINITEKIISEKIHELAQSLKDDTIDSYASEIKSLNKTHDIKTVNKIARNYVNERWSQSYLDIVGGKSILSQLFLWISDEYKLSTNKFALAREMRLSEIAPEVIKIITCIENKTDF